MTYLIAFLILAMIIAIVIPSKKTPSKKRQNKPNKATSNSATTPSTNWPDLGTFEYFVVGTSHYQNALRNLAGEHGDKRPDKIVKATLIPEDNNPHDDKAIRIDVDNTTVGYMSRDDARSFRRRLGAKKLTGQTTFCSAMIVGGYIDRDGQRMSYGLRLDIKPFF